VTAPRTSLRVGMVCPYSFDVPGGVQNHVLGLARYLRQAGHRPYVLAPGELGAATEGLDVEEFVSVGTAMPVRYNGSVARVNFGPLSAAYSRTHYAEHFLTRPLGSRTTSSGYVSRRHSTIAVYAVGRWSAARSD